MLIGGSATLLAPAIAKDQRTDTLRFVPAANLSVLDPVFTTDPIATVHGYYVFDTLYAVDGGLIPRPQMALGHDVSDDGRTWRIFFGDGMITPAISVLSAIEGLEIAIPAIGPYVVLVAASVLIAVFAIQSRGSGAVGRLFGPVMAVWFLTLAVTGIAHVLARPSVLAAFSPLYAVAYIRHASGWTAFIRMRGTAIYLTTQSETIPAALALNVKHNGVVHDQVILLKVVTDRAPRLSEESNTGPAAVRRISAC